MVTTSTNCPVCKCENTTPIMDYMSNVKFAGRLEVHTDQSYSRCDRCGAVLHLPLEIFQSDEISIYGENYYCWGKDEREMIASHSEGQMHHYDKFHDFILEGFHMGWLYSQNATAKDRFFWLDEAKIESTTAGPRLKILPPYPSHKFASEEESD